MEAPEGPPVGQQPPPRDDRKLLALAVLLLLLGAAGGVALRARLADGQYDGTGAKAAPPVGLSSEAGKTWTRLVGLLERPGAERFSFERLSGMLLRHKGNASAERFAAEFQKEPELLAAWDEFRNGQGGASDLVRRLSQSQPFRVLLNRFSSDPSFSQSGARLAAEAEAELAVLDKPEDRTQLAADAGAGLLLAGAGPPPEEERERSGWRAATGAQVVQGSGVNAGRGARSEAAAGGREHDVGRLNQIHAAGGDRNSVAFFASVFTRLEPEERRRVEAQVQEGGDLWQACQRAGALANCRSAWQSCQQDPACRNRITARGAPSRILPPAAPGLVGPIAPAGGPAEGAATAAVPAPVAAAATATANTVGAPGEGPKDDGFIHPSGTSYGNSSNNSSNNTSNNTSNNSSNNSSQNSRENQSATCRPSAGNPHRCDPNWSGGSSNGSSSSSEHDDDEGEGDDRDD